MPIPAKIVFGTMRMHEAGLSPDAWAEFLYTAHKKGIRSIHSSLEYESFSLFCKTLEIIKRRYPPIEFRHIVKLAMPSFGEEAFNVEKLLKKIEVYRKSLNSSILHDVQWMWRKDLDNEGVRLTEFSKFFDEIASAKDKLATEGLVERLLCFPYTTGFADIVMTQSFCDGLVVYRNDKERDFEPQLNMCAELGIPAIIIRPFLAGKLIDGRAKTAQDLLNRSIDHPAIESAIISTSSIKHLSELID